MASGRLGLDVDRFGAVRIDDLNQMPAEPGQRGRCVLTGQPHQLGLGLHHDLNARSHRELLQDIDDHLRVLCAHSP